MGESTSKFDFERIVPVFLREPSRSIFCANRPGRIVPGRNWFLRETSRNHSDDGDTLYAFKLSLRGEKRIEFLPNNEIRDIKG